MKSTLSRILKKHLTKKYFTKKLKNAKKLIKNLQKYLIKVPNQEFTQKI